MTRACSWGAKFKVGLGQAVCGRTFKAIVAPDVSMQNWLMGAAVVSPRSIATATWRCISVGGKIYARQWRLVLQKK